jgi:hypothetical protein
MSLSVSDDNIIRLDVGGQKFSTSKSNLAKLEGSYLAELAHGKHAPLKDGYHFVDRDPRLFPLIMEYARTGEIDLEGISKRDESALLKELDAYKIKINDKLRHKLAEASLVWDVVGKNVVLKEGGKVAVKVGGGTSWNAGIMIKKANASYSVEIKKIQSVDDNPITDLFKDHTGQIMVGFSPKIDPNGDNVRTGYYLHARTGWLFTKQKGGGKVYCDPIKLNSTIECVYDKNAKQISFVVNGENKGVAFSNIEEPNIYPSIDLQTVGSCVRLTN